MENELRPREQVLAAWPSTPHRASDGRTHPPIPSCTSTTIGFVPSCALRICSDFRWHEIGQRQHGNGEEQAQRVDKHQREARLAAPALGAFAAINDNELQEDSNEKEEPSVDAEGQRMNCSG